MYGDPVRDETSEGVYVDGVDCIFLGGGEVACSGRGRLILFFKLFSGLNPFYNTFFIIFNAIKFLNFRASGLFIFYFYHFKIQFGFFLFYLFILFISILILDLKSFSSANFLFLNSDDSWSFHPLLEVSSHI